MNEHFQANVADVAAANRQYADTFADGDRPVEPQRQLVIVTCMDSRMDIFQILGLGNGEAHIIRNAGGVVTDDTIRSLCLSQRALNTQEIILMHHTDCGLQKIAEELFRAELVADTGVAPAWSTEAFSDPYEDVRQSLRRIELSPFVKDDHLAGFVYDVKTGLLQEVEASDHPVAR